MINPILGPVEGLPAGGEGRPLCQGSGGRPSCLPEASVLPEAWRLQFFLQIFLHPCEPITSAIACGLKLGYLTLQLKKSSLVAQAVKICLQCQRPGLNPWVRKIPCRRKWQPRPVVLPGKSMDRGALQAIVHRVAKSQTRLSN